MSKPKIPALEAKIAELEKQVKRLEEEKKELISERVVAHCELVNKLPMNWTLREKEWMPLIERALTVQLAAIEKGVKELENTGVSVSKWRRKNGTEISKRYVCKKGTVSINKVLDLMQTFKKSPPVKNGADGEVPTVEITRKSERHENSEKSENGTPKGTPKSGKVKE